jgi:hypothetical protein
MLTVAALASWLVAGASVAGPGFGRTSPTSDGMPNRGQRHWGPYNWCCDDSNAGYWSCQAPAESGQPMAALLLGAVTLSAAR